MKNFKPGIATVAEICARKGVRHFVISSGSRSAPLTLALVRHRELHCLPVVDERSAGFMALGMAQQLRQPVGLVCTSGTAGLNYAPAVAEAFYQQIPLLVFTADRPPEWIDQQDGQTIHQDALFGPHTRARFQLPVDDTHPDALWHLERIVSDAINAATWPVPGPVHVNVPLREPLYTRKPWPPATTPKIVNVPRSTPHLPEAAWGDLLETWKQASKKLVIIGLHPANPTLTEMLKRLESDASVVVVPDVTANVSPGVGVGMVDFILEGKAEPLLKALAPELLLSFGGPVVSKNLKLFLRRFKPRRHWHVQPFAPGVDTFQALTDILPVPPDYLLERLTQGARATGGPSSGEGSYQAAWRRLDAAVREALARFFEAAPHSELSAMARVLEALPEGSHLQLGNSFIVRMANMIGLPRDRAIRVNSNRGTSGIDGTVSTAVGAALTSHKLTTLMVGDLAFFYDRNGLWYDPLPDNLRIVVINNQGGGIFRLLEGAQEQPELEQFFAMPHGRTAKRTAEDHGLAYIFCDDPADLARTLRTFFQPGDRPAVLEIGTDKTVNVEVFSQLKETMKEIQ